MGVSGLASDLWVKHFKDLAARLYSYIAPPVLRGTVLTMAGTG